MTEAVKHTPQGVYVTNGKVTDSGQPKESAAKNTLTYQIMEAHNQDSGTDRLSIKFDALASHDITYVGVIQTVRAAHKSFEQFPLPYVLTNCHNSLCAVGGTTNEDDHVFGLSAAKKYGGIFVPPHIAVIHQYMREAFAACGGMILGSDSHTRYGALGCMGFGEGGGELVKQLLGQTYDIPRPQVVGVQLTGKPRPGVGPQDVALSLIGKVFGSGVVKNKVLEFFGDGVANLSVDYRMGIDVMTTETTCLSSIWVTDDKVREFYKIHGREEAYKPLLPKPDAYYDSLIQIDLSKIVPMIAMPFHPSNVYTIEEVIQNAGDILRQVEKESGKPVQPGLKLTDLILPGGGMSVDQGIIAGCSGGLYESIVGAAKILASSDTPMTGAFSLSVYPASQPMFLTLVENGTASRLMKKGAVLKTAFCGPCFGAGDVPKNNALSIRHTTRNFPNREGSKPSLGQSSGVALMDALSIAQTAANGGILTAAHEFEMPKTAYYFDKSVYENRIYNGLNSPDPKTELIYGPGIRDWPALPPMPQDMLLCMAAYITDPVTTTDELIPSGETSTFRSNPYALAEHTLSRKDPGYVQRAKDIAAQKLGSVIYATKPGDGSAREQAASCQRVLGGLANIAIEYATKRYRSNLINWGMLPFLISEQERSAFGIGSGISIPGIRKVLSAPIAEQTAIPAFVVPLDGQEPFDPKPITLFLAPLTDKEREILLAGCLINYMADKL